MKAYSNPLDSDRGRDDRRRIPFLLAPAQHEEDSAATRDPADHRARQIGQSLRRPHDDIQNPSVRIEPASSIVNGVDLSHLPPDVAAAVQAYQPQTMPLGEWAEIKAFVTQIVAMTQPPTIDAVRKQLTILSRYVADQAHAGLPLEISTLFLATRVEQYITKPPRRGKVGPRTTGDYASRLRSLGRLVNPAGKWPPRSTRISASSLRPPYSDDEYASVMLGLDRLPDGPKRLAVITASHLFLGTGPTPGEAASMLTSDVYLDNTNQPWVRIVANNEDGRLVPIAGCHGPALWAIAQQHDGPLIGLGRGKNGLATLLRDAKLGRDIPALSARRMRSTWMAHRARAGASWTTIRDAAGLTTLGFVRDLATFLPDQAADATNRALAQGVVTFAVPRLSMTEPIDGLVE